MTTALLKSLSILTKPIRDSHLSDGLSTQTTLLSALQTNLSELRERMSAGELEEAHLMLEETRREITWVCSDTDDLTWGFVQECLLLLFCLARHFTRLLEDFHQNPAAPNLRTPEAAPPLPPDVLSVAQQKTLGTVLQFVVTLGLCPYLAPGVGVALGLRSAFGAAVEEAVRHDVAPVGERRLLITTNVLLDVSTLSSLATPVFTRHLGDIMAALCQLAYRPEGESTKSNKGLTVEERKSCKEALHNLLGKVYQPIVIKELLVLQGGPKQASSGSRGGSAGGKALIQAPPWLRRLCGQLLSERLMQPHGVQAVVRAILEGTGAGGDSDWRKCDAVAKILASCPQQSLSAESYYSQVCPQILELLHFKDKLTAQQFQRVATRAVLTMVQERPEFAQRFLLLPLLSPLHRCTEGTGNDLSQDAVQEWELTRCIEDIYKICVVGNNPSEVLLKALDDAFSTLFSLFCFTKQNVSHLRIPCQEILIWCLSHSKRSVALSLLKRLCGLLGEVDGVRHDFQFSPGSEGGARLTVREPISDEDDVLFEKVSGDQWRVQCLVQLLEEMKDSDMPGEFFLLLLQDLTALAAEKEDRVEEVVDTSSMTLLELEQHLLGREIGHGQRLALLQTLAIMCEGLPHTALLRKPTQVVGFIVSMLKRACVGLEHGIDSPVESQTLSMGMGLVATLLSGAAELSADDYLSMATLLPPLEQISQQHPETVIQELASDLRATIATHGAYHPKTVSRTDCQHNPDPSTSQPTGQSSNTLPANIPSSRLLSIPQTSPTSRRGDASPGQPPSTHSYSSEDTPRTLVSQVPTSSVSRPKHTTDPGEAPKVKDSCHGTEPKPGQSAGRIANPGISEGPPSKAFTECLLEACDPDVPSKSVALRSLTRSVRDGDKEALQNKDKLLTLFLENLEHEDSFVYLSAIQGLAVLADTFPEQILQRLLGEYQTGATVCSPKRQHSLETCLKVGEVLMRASRAMGDLAPHYGRPLIGVFLNGTRDKRSSVRASSLSNLGELCQRLNFSLGPLAQELSTCLTALIKTDREAEVRRAAVHVIALVLRGLSDKTTQVLGDVLLELYRALKWVVRSDPDDVAVLHAQLALEELDVVMRRFIFPQQKLEKKIVVLP
ncbi:transport and Golgi organization protein 6 homolog isoform X1 [Myxocyprinus asiaticus]|uniref:transport and Golgi organization protein 6 homolog isoform X1 n=1 Tax=Myxocyprinus asiaticus TaxID=70543 RepID=UPI002222618C|nr:transport and Golgi organization protein 6 homolog isoform X1 [Myxocyprinus asiaticus]